VESVGSPENPGKKMKKPSVDAAVDLIALNQRFKWDGFLCIRLFAR